MRVGELKIFLMFRMCQNLTSSQLEIHYYTHIHTYVFLYMNSIETTNQKPIVQTLKIIYTHNVKKSHQITGKRTREERNRETIKTTRKQVTKWQEVLIRSDQITSVAESCRTLCDPMNRSTPGHPVQHQLPEFTQTHVHQVSDAIQPSHPLSSPSPLAPNPSQHQSLFQWVNSSHEVAKVLEFQL